MSVSFVASVLGGLLHWLESLYAAHGYLIMAVLISGESAGLPLPGETSLLAGAVEAQRGALVLFWVVVVGAAAAVAGDNAGYLVGRHAGRGLLLRYGRFIHVREKEMKVLDYYFSRHGAATVFFGRWVLILRAGAALFAGASRMPWPRFFLWNALGALAWATGVSLVGYFFAASVGTIKTYFGYAGVAALVLAVIGGYLFVRRTEKRLFERVEDGEAGGDQPGAGSSGGACRREDLASSGDGDRDEGPPSKRVA